MGNSQGSHKSSTPLGMGCYLTYESSQAGTLYLNWSEADKVPGALAYFKPAKPVPKFKFTKNGGKEELIRDCALIKIQRHFQGWTQFIKLAREFNAQIMILTSDVRVYLNRHGPVDRLSPGKFYSFDKVAAVAVVGKDNSTLDAKVLEKSVFVENGNRNGAALLF